MIRLLVALAVAAVLGFGGYVLGSSIADDPAWALAFAAIGFALGFALSAMATTTTGHQDEHPSTRSRSS